MESTRRPIEELKKHKRCTKCEKIKHVREFYAHQETKDGLNSWCRECASAVSYGNPWGGVHSDM